MSQRPKPGSSARIAQLLNLACAEEHRVGAILRQRQQELDEMVRELSRLRQYRLEYQRSLDRDQHEGVDQLRNLQQFLKTLDEAVEVKTNHMVTHQDIVETARRDWVEAYQQVQALTKLRDTRAANEVFQQNRIQQRLSDELVTSRLGAA